MPAGWFRLPLVSLSTARRVGSFKISWLPTRTTVGSVCSARDCLGFVDFRTGLAPFTDRISPPMQPVSLALSVRAAHYCSSFIVLLKGILPD